MPSSVSRYRYLPWFIISSSILLTLAAFFVPVAESVANPVAAHWRTAASMLMFMLYFGAAVALLIGARNFKRELQFAYRFLAAGMVAFSATFIQLVIWGLYDMWDSAWAASGSGLWPFFAGAVLTYAGTRKFSRLIGVKSVFNSFWVVTALTLLTGAVLYSLALGFVQYEQKDVEMYITVCALCAGYFLYAGLLVVKIRQLVGVYYKKAMHWLSVAFIGTSLAALHEAINTFWFNNGDTYTDYGYYLIPFVVAGMLLVRAASVFVLLPNQAVKADTLAPVGEVLGSDYVDSIVAIAGLASRPQDLDPMLDPLRIITSHADPAAPLSPDDTRELLKVYRQVEAYLIADDKLRKFTKEEIRSHATPAFRAMLSKQ